MILLSRGAQICPTSHRALNHSGYIQFHLTLELFVSSISFFMSFIESIMVSGQLCLEYFQTFLG